MSGSHVVFGIVVTDPLHRILFFIFLLLFFKMSTMKYICTLVYFLQYIVNAYIFYDYSNTNVFVINFFFVEISTKHLSNVGLNQLSHILWHKSLQNEKKNWNISLSYILCLGNISLVLLWVYGFEMQLNATIDMLHFFQKIYINFFYFFLITYKWIKYNQCSYINITH